MSAPAEGSSASWARAWWAAWTALACAGGIPLAYLEYGALGTAPELGDLDAPTPS